MPPPLLQLQDISLSFGVMPLFSGATLAVAAGDRISFVGRNGSGESTLLRIAAGLVQADTGERFAQPGATIQYLPQEPDLAGFGTTLAYVEDVSLIQNHNERIMIVEGPSRGASGSEAARGSLRSCLIRGDLGNGKHVDGHRDRKA